MPVAAVAGEPRGLDRDHGADAALADGGEQLLEARPGDPGAGAAEIVVDHLDGGPAQRTGAIDEGVLPTAALVIVEHLIGGRLAHIDEGAAGQVLRRDLGHRRPPERPACRRVLLADAGRLRQEALQKRGQLGLQLGPQVRNRRPLVEQIPLTVSFAPHHRLPCGGTIPARMRLGAHRPGRAPQPSARAKAVERRRAGRMRPRARSSRPAAAPGSGRVGG